MISKLLLRFALGPSFLEPVDDKVENTVSIADKANREKSVRVAQAQTSILEFIGLGDQRGRQRTDQAGRRRFIRQIRRPRRVARSGNHVATGGGNDPIIEVDFMTGRAFVVDESDHDYESFGDDSDDEFLDNVFDELYESPEDGIGVNVDGTREVVGTISTPATASNNSQLNHITTRRRSRSILRASTSHLSPITPSTTFIPLTTLLLHPSTLNTLFPTSYYHLTTETKDSSNWLVRNILNPSSLSTIYHVSNVVVCWPFSSVRTLTAAYDISLSDAFRYKYRFPWTIYRNPWDTFLLLLGFETVKGSLDIVKHFSDNYLLPRLFNKDIIKKENSPSSHNTETTDYSTLPYKITKFLINNVIIETASSLLAYPFYHRYITNTLEVSPYAPTILQMFSFSFYSNNAYLICTLLGCRIIESVGSSFLNYLISKVTKESQRVEKWSDFLYRSADPRILESSFEAEFRLHKSISNTTTLMSSFLGELLCLPIGLYTTRLFANTYSHNLPIATQYFPSSLAYALVFEWFSSWALVQSFYYLMKLSPLITLSPL